MRPCFSVRFASIVLAFAVVLPGTVGAVDTPVEDEIFGVLTEQADWSEGLWVDTNNPGDQCITFEGGQSTGPGFGDHFLDQIVCSFTPNKWSWDVTIPGPNTIYWTVQNFPCGIIVCGQIFYAAGIGPLQAAVDLQADWIVVRDLSGNLLYEGVFSTFDPQEHGFQMTELRRCGFIECPSTPVEPMTWGKIKSLHR